VFVSAEATILHADLDSFFASVEQRDAPRLRGRPVAVGGGVVLAASYEAKAYGVRTAMGGWQARKLCPGLVVVRPRFEAYTEASRAVFEVFDDMCPAVEALSIDEAFLDVRGMRRIAGAPGEIAARLRRRVRAEVGLPITVGVARTKFLAKVASGVAKPDGLLVVAPERELAFLHPLPVERLWGVGGKSAAKLHAHGITTVGQVAELPEGLLMTLLGKAAGRKLHALAHNRDPRPLAAQDPTHLAIMDRLGRRLRGAGRVCRTVVLRLRFDDFARATRSQTLSAATSHTPTLVAAARELLTAAMPLIAERGLTLLGYSLTNLADVGGAQLVLPLDRRTGLDAALDDVRERFGSGAITRAVLLGRDTGYSMPLLPD
jgi:DNA polymerase-4